MELTSGGTGFAGLPGRGRSIGALEDRVALRDLVESYAAAVDARDVELFVSLFTADGVLQVHYADLPDPHPATVGAAALARIPGALSMRFPVTFHFVGNHRCQVDGARAVGETYCEAHHLHTGADGEPADLRMAIRYADTYTREAGSVWRFTRRTVNVLWQQDGPVTASVPHRP